MNAESFAQGLTDKFPKYVFSVEAGRKFDKIVMARADATFGRGVSVHAFVDRSNGDLIKPGSWSAPAKWKSGWAVSYNLVTEFEKAIAEADWAGGYLYQR